MHRPHESTADPIGRILDQCASEHTGILTRGDLQRHGVSRHRIEGLIARGLIIRVQPGVYRAAGTTMTIRRRLIAACLASRGISAVSHRAALWVWELSEWTPPVEISVTTGRHPLRDDVVVHRSRDLRTGHITLHRGITVTTPARTLVDVGCVVPRSVFTTALERALHNRLVTVPGLRSIIDEVRGRGRNGVGVLRTVLDDRALGDARPESMLEPLMARLCAQRFGIDVTYQQELVLDGRRLRPDFIIPEARIVIEVDGLGVHGTREALDHDLERQNLLVAHGYQVLRYTSSHLRHPDRIASQILATAQRRRAELHQMKFAP